MSSSIKVGIAGNPNCGKTTLFNALTGVRQKVGNWPGVTVERKEGEYSYLDENVSVVDLPGIYSLSSSSLDEKVARDYILQEKPDIIVNILDAANLERNLYLTMQLMEMKVPMILVLNMMDMLKAKQLKIKVEELSKSLGLTVIPMVASKEKGIEILKDAIAVLDAESNVSSVKTAFPLEVEKAISGISDYVQAKDIDCSFDMRWVATKLLEGDISLQGLSDDRNLSILVESAKETIEKVLGEDVDIVIADSRYGMINSLSKNVIDKSYIVRKHITEKIDSIVLNRILGIPIFLMAMYLTFWMTINLGGCFIDFFDGAFGAVFVDGFGNLLDAVGTPAFLKTLLANGIGGGIQTVSTFIPPIFFMFLCLAVLEDSGYMARAAFVMDRVMQAIGLPGKAFVPMLIGFGCNVPAIMATRTLENERDRILTVMMSPFMSCGARMPVYALFAAAFFPNTGSTVVFALYLTGIFLALITALILKNTVLKGETSSFIMELPSYHIPTIRGIFFHTWDRLKLFIVRAGKAILLVVIILNFFNSIGTDGSFGHENTEKSVLSVVGKGIVPVFKPMGMTEENWPAAVGIFMGVFAKEAVIGTLNTLYVPYTEEEEVSDFDFSASVSESFATIGENLSGLSMPFSLAGLLGAEVDSAIDDLEISEATYVEMQKRFDGKAGGFAYLLMILLYMPCVAAIAAVYRELGLGWTIFSSFYLSALAWVVSTVFYQVARFGQHPLSSSGWILFSIFTVVVFVVALLKKGSAYENNKGGDALNA